MAESAVGAGGQSLPRVTIGLPVYNGENFLAEAIGSILTQTYADFELVISDNASTDRTEQICRAFEASDGRIRYVRQERNRGAAPNYNFVFEQARGEYFKWAAHDDVVHPTFLEKAVEELDKHPQVELVYSKVREIDEFGVVTGTYDRYEGRLRLSAAEPHTRFGDMICVPHNCVGFFGLMRTEELRKTPLHAPYEGSDRALLAEIALMGPVHRISEYLIDRRNHAGAYTRSRHLGDRIGWWDVDQVARITFPTWRSAREYARSIRRVQLSGRERARCRLELVRWLFGPHWYRQRWMRLVRDFAYGVVRMVWEAIRGSARKQA